MAITAHIGGTENGGPPGGMQWDIQYDDVTQQITGQASGGGRCMVTVQVTNAITRTVAFAQAGVTPAADFVVTVDAGPTIIASGIPPAQVKRIVGKAGAQGGLNFFSEWSRV